MFFGGVYLPQWLLPDFLNRIGEFIPPGVHGILDAWLGAPLQVAPLVAMVLIAVVASAVAARTFRWE
jgi:ABC-2 type transport system permease protein